MRKNNKRKKKKEEENTRKHLKKGPWDKKDPKSYQIAEKTQNPFKLQEFGLFVSLQQKNPPTLPKKKSIKRKG